MLEIIYFAPIKDASSIGQMNTELSMTFGTPFVESVLIRGNPDTGNVVKSSVEGTNVDLGQLVAGEPIPQHILEAIKETGLVINASEDEKIRIKEGISKDHPQQLYMEAGYAHTYP
ncbi:MAG: hypothetical protein IH934_07270 [Nanoarchaeota archaeon]|nr:hypothetical protein [Nanoarchaeota archaeon]